ncbi:MAG TPA: hypothetical protein VL475_08885 [Planctomycetaceae bacterium]|nr:hypothetical protein [Planctomycetaceae bacterium]
MRVSWERTTDGQPARRHEFAPIAGPHVQPLAWQAVTDLSRIRARFSGNEILFLPVMTLLAKHCNWAAGWSLLRRETAVANDAPDSTPDLCLRTCQWDNVEALRGLADAPNSRDYIADSLPLKCAIRFVSSSVVSVATLMGETAQALSAGVRFEKRERINQGGEIDFRYCDGLQTYRFTYFPATSTAPRLEGLFAEWHTLFQNAERAPQQIPDDGCFVAYEESVWERLLRYS